MSKPKILLPTGYGINCDEETQFAFNEVGGKADIVHIDDIIANPNILDNYQILALSGGFSYGDDTGSGKAFANRIRNNLGEKIYRFTEKDKLAIGICNGFQVMVSLGLLPNLGKQGEQQVALTPNDSARFIARWVDLEFQSNSPWLNGIKEMSLPIAHGEGRFYTGEKILQELVDNNQIAIHYTSGEICKYQNLEANPNGSLLSIAGITDPTGRILGMMPHPERAIKFTQLPNWPIINEHYKRLGFSHGSEGPGLQIFKNSISYFK